MPWNDKNIDPMLLYSFLFCGKHHCHYGVSIYHVTPLSHRKSLYHQYAFSSTLWSNWWNSKVILKQKTLAFLWSISYSKMKYSQTCSNNHSSKMTNLEFPQANPHTVVTVWDNHLSNAASDHFVHEMEHKNLSQAATAKLYPIERWGGGGGGGN